MKKVAALAGVAALGLSGQAQAVTGTASVTFSWSTGGTSAGWTSSGGTSVITSVGDSQYFTSKTGQNSTTYFNSDFATSGWFATSGGSTFCPPTFRSQYACKIASPGIFPVADADGGATASGSLAVTSSTLTGTLSVGVTTDEGAGPQLGTTTATAFNVRSADGSPFKNVWYGYDTTATLSVALTGTFGSSTWDITGGTVRISDTAGYQCAAADFSGVLCATSTVAGGQDPSGGSQLSWGWDLDGGGTGTAVGEIEVRDKTGVSIIDTLSGVLANLSLAGSTISTNSGEYRSGLGSASGGCSTYVRYDAANNTMDCGTITTGDLVISGTFSGAAPVPVPAAAWLFGSALGLLGWIRRRVSA